MASNENKHPNSSVLQGENLYEVIYASNATHLMSQDDLIQLLLQCRKNNPPLELTGMLLYRAGYFLQVLEGPKECIDHMYHRIAKDVRHKNLSLLVYDKILSRSFSEWSMGFVAVDSRCEQLEEFFNLLYRNLLENKMSECKQSVYNMFKEFRSGSLRGLIK
ncbi:BLUF domain-containing protein [Fundidesulfovibrio magnetotacticus]|uniref:BLUF domain-containing protein n=1 Tax=Fundidesulfovibrio magnetotacticus TaxID=2730080 RepID=UPI0015666390|nr:BLUF domain-containing protein [Fundidesulfovibrio magnetotacticus]